MTPAPGDSLGDMVCALHSSGCRQVPGASPKAKLTATSFPVLLMTATMMTASFFIKPFQETRHLLSPSTTVSGSHATEIMHHCSHPLDRGSLRHTKCSGVWSAQGQSHQRWPRSRCKHFWPCHQDPSPTPIPKAMAESLPRYLGSLPPPPTTTTNARRVCWSHAAAAGNHRSNGVSDKRAGLLPGQVQGRVNLLFKQASGRLSGFKQASAVLPFEPVGDHSTDQYESSFLEEVAAPCQFRGRHLLL